MGRSKGGAPPADSPFAAWEKPLPPGFARSDLERLESRDLIRLTRLCGEILMSRRLS